MLIADGDGINKGRGAGEGRRLDLINDGYSAANQTPLHA